MALSNGTRLGPYEILAPLGSGGMGEVYKARDTRLERTVAIKVLPQGLSSSPEVRQRFEREARTISQLSHPHICALYDIGREGETEYLVMEYLEGETLADRLAKGRLPLEQALRFGIQIADALDKAHRQGIVHRDLKPGNVMLTRSGVKLLDFGLATLAEKRRETADSRLSAIATVGVPLTAEGTILGTLQYMAPEQLEGKSADARADLFAFGAVLYEMVAGERAFSGSSQASVIASILSSEPKPISVLVPASPRSLDRAIRRCLARDPDDRWQSARDVLLELRSIQEAGPSTEPDANPKIRPRERLAWILCGVLLLAGLAGVRFATPRAATPVRPLRFEIPPPENTYLQGFLGPLAVSPDGSRLALLAVSGDGKPRLWLRPLDSLTPIAFGETEGASFPFWSADGRSLAFFAQGKLKILEVSSGSVRTLCDAPAGYAGAWSRQGVILFSLSPTGPIYRIAAEGGAATAATALDSSREDVSHGFASFLPDGHHFVFLVRSRRAEKSGIYAGSLGSKENRFLFRAESNVAWAPSLTDDLAGSLLFARGQTLIAQPFDPGGLRILGDPSVAATRVLRLSGGVRAAVFSVGAAGVLAYQSAAHPKTRLVWIDRAGKTLGILSEAAEHIHVDLSPDGKRAAVERIDPEAGIGVIWLHDISRGVASRFTTDQNWSLSPVWSPDGSRIAFSSNRGDAFGLYQKPSGGGDEELLLSQVAPLNAIDWSPDGKIVYRTTTSKGDDLWSVPVAGDRKPSPVMRTGFSETYGRLSPDGRWLAYSSNESGRPELYVRAFSNPSARWQISPEGGTQPRWRSDGKELFYVAADRRLMAVAVTTGSTFEAGIPRSLFSIGEKGFQTFVWRTDYAVTPDGERFLVNLPVGDVRTSGVTVVLNWHAGR